MSSQQQQQQRQYNVKKASSETQRRVMNERRHELTQRIRKTKRSHLVARKRRFTSTSPIPPTGAALPIAMNQAQDPPLDAASDQVLANVAWAYIRSKDVTSLSALHSALMARQKQSNGTASSLTTLFLSHNQNEVQPSSEDTPAMQLANTLSYTLTSPSTSTDQMRLLAARILTNLAATENATTKQQQNDYYYYQPQPEGWCDVLILSNALPGLIQTLNQFTSTLYIQQGVVAVSSSPVMEVCQQCCWALGNICGDSQRARYAAQQAGAIVPLITSLENGLQWNHAGICRNATWALSNLTRTNGVVPGIGTLITTTTTTTTADVASSSSSSNNHHLLTSCLMAQLLLTPEQKQNHTTTTTTTTWWDVAYEACWVLAFVTAREDEAVDALLSSSSASLTFSSQPTSKVCEALACRLECATQTLLKPVLADGSINPEFGRAIQMLIPCLRAVGNIATASSGQYVPTLLSCRNKAIVQSLITILKLGYSGNGGLSDLATVAVEAAWACGTLLCDAGVPNHASTTIAAPALLPILCQTLTSQRAKLELKREAVSAVWNCIAAPPSQKQDMGHDVWSSRPIRDEFLERIVSVTVDAQQQQQQQQEVSIVMALVELVKCRTDMDAVLGAIQVLNALLRRLAEQPTYGNVVRIQFLEADGVDVLEDVCDRASQAHIIGGDGGCEQSSSALTQSADLAADLIDDLFFADDYIQEEDNDDQCDDAKMASSPDRSNKNTFKFGMATDSTRAVFDFSGNAAATTMSDASSPPPAVGRGKPAIPAWMARGEGSTPSATNTTGAKSRTGASYPW